jgi:hypothetical protein
MHTHHEQTCVVFITKEFERLESTAGIDVEWVDRVLLVEVDGMREFEGVLKDSSDQVRLRQTFKLTRSFIAILTGSLVFSPLTKMAVFSFSTSCGSRASNARLERAFFGLL